MMGTNKTGQYCVGDLLVDAARAQVMRAGEEVPLPKLSFDLLLALMEAAPAVVSTDELSARVWPGLVVSPETVTQRIKLLREALGDDSRQPRYLAVVRGRGCRLIAEVKRIEPAPPSSADTSTSLPGPSITGANRQIKNWRWGRWAIAAVGVVAAILLVIVYRHGALGPRSAKVSSATASPMATPGTIAVLPFTNLTGDASKDYLGDGMADELINTLTKVPGLKVPARTSSFAYKSRSADIRQIAKDLGVATVLEGSVRTAGERIRITAQLVNAQDGLQIWSESYDRQFTDLFKLQDDLATAIVNALQVKLGGVMTSSVTPAHPTQDIEAYQLYLRGWALADRVTEQNEKRAIEYFQQAIARDPKFARAYDSIANAHMDMGASLGLRPFENFAAAERAAQQALALDPSSGNAHSVLAGVNIFRRNWLEGAAHSRAASLLAPNDGYTRTIRTLHLLYAGHTQEALAQAIKAMEVAPANPFIVAYAAMANAQAGNNEEAQKLAAVAEELGYPRDSRPVPTIRAYAALNRRRYSEAAAMVATTLGASDADQARTAEVVKLVFAALENPLLRKNALLAKTRLYPAVDESNVNGAAITNISPCLESGYLYALLNDLDAAYGLAIQCLDRTAPGSVFSGNAGFYLWMPALRHFRRDSRFQAFITRLGLMEYYQQYGPPDDCDLKNGKLTCR